MDVSNQTTEDERKLNNLATRIMSNGVEVLVKDKGVNRVDQRKLKHIPPIKLPQNQVYSSPSNVSLISSEVATVVNHQRMTDFFPLHPFMQHNYIIKTCMTTYTYLTTVVQNKRSAVSTFETTVSVVTTESLTNVYATDVFTELQPTKTKFMEVKTVQPSSTSYKFSNNGPKIDKRIDNDDAFSFDIIQPSEENHASCSTSCTCSHTKTEDLKTRHTNINGYSTDSQKYTIKSTRYSDIKIKSTHKEPMDKKTQYRPYEYESSSQLAPTDKIVEKYTEVISDYSDDKDTHTIEANDLLTNEQAPVSEKINKTSIIKNTNTNNKEHVKPQNVDKNKLVVAELIKLGSLGIKGLSQLAPVVIEKMTGGFMKRQDNINKTSIITSSTTSVKPITKVMHYTADKRIDNNIESKHGSFPIYIPVDEMETAESQVAFTNATLHQNLAWAAEFKYPKAHDGIPSKSIHESPLVNGGIPISPGEIITANSDVIVGKPAVGGPLTLGASGIKLQNSVSPPIATIQNFVSNNENYIKHEKPSQKGQVMFNTKVDDSFDLRPPDIPVTKLQLNNNSLRLQGQQMADVSYSHLPNYSKLSSDPSKPNKIEVSVRERPAFLEYIIPSPLRPANNNPIEHSISENKKPEILDNSPSSSEIVSSKITTDGEYIVSDSDSIAQPFLVDIQPSKVANVLIPHGSSTALVFAGSSEPHKTGNYVDAPLPYPEPGYFGSFSIDAPQMTNVHNVFPNKNHFFMNNNDQFSSISYKINTPSIVKEPAFKTDVKTKNENKRPKDFNRIPAPISIQETHIQVGPQVTVYNPDIYKEDFQQFNRINNKQKEVIDKEYEKFLSVPPPPPKLHYSQGNYPEKNKLYHQRPFIHTKPMHDSKVLVNIQHPIPNQLPPKVTSEIYFASQLPNAQPTSSYTIKLQQTPHLQGSLQNKFPENNNLQKLSNSLVTVSQKSAATATPPNLVKKPIIASSNNEHSYSVTLNTATNIDSNNDQGHSIGSSISVPISTSQHNGQVNANIPIGTNFAIRVEDDPAKYESVALHGKIISSINNNEYDHYLKKPNNKFVPHSKDNSSTVHKESFGQESHALASVQVSETPIYNGDNSFSLLNSHDNFQATKELHSSSKNKYSSSDRNDQREKPLSRISDTIVQTNSHGWYSSVLNESNLKKVNVDNPSRTIIPLNYNKDSGNLPEFGHKLATVGKPPTDLWDLNTKHLVNNFNIGKPFSIKTEQENLNSSTIKETILGKYIPSFSDTKQLTYKIPVRSSEELSGELTSKGQNVKLVYENADEIYDGQNSSDDNSDSEGEISSESMKVPILASSTNQQIYSPEKPEFNQKQSIDNDNSYFYNSSTNSQTEKPFGSQKTSLYHSNNIEPVFDNNNYIRPRPFMANPAIPLDHQLQQPHWQINQLMVNSTNVSDEDNVDLNIGEEISTKPANIVTLPKPSEHSYSINEKGSTNVSVVPNRKVNGSNIITSTIQIQDKKPIMVKFNEKATLPTFTISTDYDNKSTGNEIFDLSPPPPTLSNHFTDNELIMGMSPPPAHISVPIRTSQRKPQTPKPILPLRTTPPYLVLPPKSLPRSSTQKPITKTTGKDEISTYRPIFDILNKIKRPIINQNQPSSQLLPPPMPPTRITFLEDLNVTRSNIKVSFSPNTIIFPTSISSSWLTSSGIDFSSGINFAPTSVYVLDTSGLLPPKSPQESNVEITNIPFDSSYSSYEYESSSEVDFSSENSEAGDKFKSKQEITPPIKVSDTYGSSLDEINKNTTTKKTNLKLANKNRTRKPYPVRNDDKKNVTNKYSVSFKPTSIIKPTRTFSRPEILYPTRYATVNKIIRPLLSKTTSVYSSNIIESSESSIDEYFVVPTEDFNSQSMTKMTPIIEKILTSTLTDSRKASHFNGHQTHHAGNEIKISDDILPTKTEIKTTVITHTKTLSEPAQTVSSIGFVNFTHTLTVTQTKTSLVSQSEGAFTQTLVLTNTQTSTIVDVITEIYTQVEPTTIIETVTKHIPVPQVDATPVQNIPSTSQIALDDISMSSEERDSYIIKDNDVTENIQKIQEIEEDKDNDTFFVVMNKSQNGGKTSTVNTDIDTDNDFDGITRNEQVNSHGVSQVLFGEILLAGTPYLETTNVGHPTGVGYSKECQPDCKASRNERCQRIDGVMKCVCRPGFARMFPDRPCKPTYTYSVSLALGSQGNERLKFDKTLSDNSSKEYHELALSSYEGINRMIMQSDLRDVYHGAHITNFHPVSMKADKDGEYQGVVNDFYVQLSDNAHESRLKEVIEKYLRHNNFSLGGTTVSAAEELIGRLNVSDFDECVSHQFHDCSEHARCFNLRGTYTCSCLEGYADLSVNTMYPGRICSSDAVGCAGCNYHGTCFDRESMMICECFKWYAGKNCQVNLKAVLITVTVSGAVVIIMATIYAVKRCCCQKGPATQTFVIGCMQGMPSLHQANMPSKHRADRRALIAERTEIAESCSAQNTSLPYIPIKQHRSRSSTKKQSIMGSPPAHAPPPPPAPAVLIPRARLHHDSRDNLSRKRSLEVCSEAKLISYLESGAGNSMNDEMRRKHSIESSYSVNRETPNKQGALVSAGFKVSTTVRPDEAAFSDHQDDASSINKTDLETELSRFDTLRKSYSQEDMAEWADAERRIGELTLSEARSIGGTLPASTGRAASSTRLTHQEVNTMAERDLGSTFLLPHVHLYKTDLTSDVSEFDSL